MQNFGFWLHFYAIFFPFLLFSASYMHVHTSARLLTYMRVSEGASASALAQKKFFYFSQLWTKFLKILFTSLLVSANMSSACPPSSRVSPICHSAKPYGQGNTRRAHIKRRRLIMPLVALVQKKQSAPATVYKFWCLALASVVATAPPIPSSKEWVLVIPKNKKPAQVSGFSYLK